MSQTFISSTILGAILVAASIGSVACGGGEHFAVGVGIPGGPPVFRYGYYEAPPYNCAPDGYYGPEWFANGVFIGAGPWYRGADHFYGHVDHRLDYRHGYHGPFPARGSAPIERRAPFRGQAMHDARGHEAPGRR